MNSYNTFFGFHALSNTPMRLDSEENNRINKEKTLEGLINDGYRIEERKNFLSHDLREHSVARCPRPIFL